MDNKSMAWVRWEIMTTSKYKGGMGFKDFQLFNKALLYKLSWRIMQNSNAFCVQLLRGKYFPSGNFMDAVKGANSSWIWKSIIAGKEVFKKGARWNVVSGIDTNIWMDPWVPSLPHFKIQTQSPSNCEKF